MGEKKLITTEEHEGYKVIHMKQSSKSEFSTQFAEDVGAWLDSETPAFVFDFQGVTDISKENLRLILNFSQELKKQKKTLYSINIKSSLKLDLKSQGLNSALGITEDLNSVFKAPGTHKKKALHVDVDFLQPFIGATQDVLKVQAQTELTAGRPVLAKDFIKPEISIAGVINLNSDCFTGSISLCFEKSTFLKIYENMMGEKADNIDGETQDAAAELLNIIYGQAKKVLVDEKKYSMKPAIPNVLIGEKLEIYYKSKAPVIILPFESEAGSFHIEIVVDDQIK